MSTTTFKLVSTTSAMAVAGLLTLASPAVAASDSDGDGMPNRWERVHHLNPNRADARGDADKDGLTNIAEFRNGADPQDEDTDNDGDDDGDEVHDGFAKTDVDDADTNNNGRLDGDEDADHDGVDNEDEDDATEGCAADDDDTDTDGIDNEDEDDFGTSPTDPDSDHNGIDDGDEDGDEDGETNEDADDSATDKCDGDHDGDGQADEDEGDLFGVITSYDDATGTLVVTASATYVVTGHVTEDTEIQFEDNGDGDGGDATVADLTPGTEVAELEVDDENGDLEEVSIYPPAP